MSLILKRANTKKNEHYSLNNSNKNIFIRKNLPQKMDNLNLQNEIQEKKINKNNSNATDASVKKNKQMKKISINDYENKKFLKNGNINNNNNKNNNNNNKSLLIKKNTLLKSKKKLDIENKENQIINNKEKNENKKIQSQ